MPASFEPSDGTDSPSKSKQGRPTKQMQISIHTSMQKCFENGISAPSAARLMKVNFKTAYRHYNEITKKIIEQNHHDLLEREESERVQITATYDNDIIELTELLDGIKYDMQTYKDNGKSVPPILVNQALSIIRSRHAIKAEKSAYNIKPTLRDLSKQGKGKSDDKS